METEVFQRYYSVLNEYHPDWLRNPFALYQFAGVPPSGVLDHNYEQMRAAHVWGAIEILYDILSSKGMPELDDDTFTFCARKTMAMYIIRSQIEAIAGLPKEQIDLAALARMNSDFVNAQQFVRIVLKNSAVTRGTKAFRARASRALFLVV